MYFLYFHILCYILLRTVNSYVILTENIDDFRRIAEKLVPNDFAEQIDEMDKESDYKYARDRTIEYFDVSRPSPQESFEFITDALTTTETRPNPVNTYSLESAPQFAPVPLILSPPAPTSVEEPAEPPVLPYVAPHALTLEDIVEKVKERLQEDLLNRSILANTQAHNAQPLSKQLLNAQPLSAEPLSAQPLSAQPFNAQPLNAQPFNAQPLNAQSLNAEPLNAPPLNAQPLNTQPLNAQPLNAQPLNAQPLSAQPLSPQPLNTQPINTQPLNIQRLNAQASYAQPVDVLQVAGPPVYKNFPKKLSELPEANPQVQSPAYDYKVPMHVLKEEVQYEATYEESQDKIVNPKTFYQELEVQSQPQLLENKLNVDVTRTVNVLPLQENRLVNPNYAGVGKKIRYVKQIVVPAKSIQQQPSYIQQPRVYQQPRVVQQPLVIQEPLVVQQPSLKQQQTQQLNRNALQIVLKNYQQVRPTPLSVLPPPPSQTNEGAIAANLESVPKSNGSEIFLTLDMDKSIESNENYVSSSKEEELESQEAKETTFKTAVKFKHKINTKTPSVPTVVEEEENSDKKVDEVVQNSAGVVDQDPVGVIDQDPAEAVEYDYEATEATTGPEAQAESTSFEGSEIKLKSPNTTTRRQPKVTVLSIKKKAKRNKKKFHRVTTPNFYAKLPIEEKYNFNEPIPEKDRERENIKPSVEKVTLL